MSADAQPDVLDVRFPTRRILAIIGDKWTTVVLYCLSIGERGDALMGRQAQGIGHTQFAL